jgi:parallel beta-helix repeat protein
VEDISSTTRITLTVGSQSTVENTRNLYQAGTVALLSGWAKTSFRNIVVKDLSGNILYDLVSSWETFNDDWKSIQNEDPVIYPYDAADWLFDAETMIISCDATTNTPGPFYYPYAAGDPDNFGLPPSGAANGKYAVLVLKVPNSLDWRNYIVEGQIKLQKRNGGLSEQGVGVRYNTTDPNNLLKGKRYHKALVNNRPDPPPTSRPDNGAETGLRNYHFRDYSTYLLSLFYPDGIRAAHQDWYDGFPGWNAQGGYRDFQDNNKYFELILYENSACQGVLEFIYTVYQDDIISLKPDANNFLVLVQNNHVAKWYSRMNFDPANDFILGGRSNLNFDGDKNAAATMGDLARTNLLYSGLYKIARDFSSQWSSVTTANPSQYLPNTDTLYQYYHDQTYNTARYLISRMWSYPTEDYYQWYYPANGWGEFANYGCDLNHAGLVIWFLLESYHHGFVTQGEIEKLSRTFTTRIWNQSSTEDGIDLSVDIHGYLNASEYTNNTTQNADFFILLSEIDFKVWEIFDSWLQKMWGAYKCVSAWATTHRYSSLHPALMLSSVKFGKPRNLTTRSISQNSVTLNWSHPSSWPGGTRLKYYNIYRREYGQTWPSTPTAQVLTSALSFTDNGLDPTKIYQYNVRSQDRTSEWTPGYRNESDASNILSIHQGEVVNVIENGTLMTGAVILNQSYVLPFGNELVIQSVTTLSPPTGAVRKFWAFGTIRSNPNSTLQINSGVTLSANASSRFDFGSNSQLIINGNLIAKGTAAQHITFMSGNPSPQPGDWYSVLLKSGPNTMQYCDVSNATYGIAVQNLSTNLIENCTVQNCLNYGIATENTSVNANSTVIRNCTLTNNGGGISVGNGRVELAQTSSSFGVNNNGWGIVLWTGGKIYMKNAYVTGNTSDGIFVNGSTANATLSPDGVGAGYNHIENNSGAQVKVFQSGGAYIGERHIHSVCNVCSGTNARSAPSSALDDTIEVPCPEIICEFTWTSELCDRLGCNGTGGGSPCPCGYSTYVHNHAGYNYIKGNNSWVDNSTSSNVLAQLQYWGNAPYACPAPGYKFYGPVNYTYCFGGGGSPMAGRSPASGEVTHTGNSTATRDTTLDALAALRLLAALVGPGGPFPDSLHMPWEAYVTELAAKTATPTLKSLALAYLVQARMDRHDYEGVLAAAASILLTLPDDELWFHCQAEMIYALAAKGSLEAAEATYAAMRPRGELINPSGTLHLAEFLSMEKTSGGNSPGSFAPQIPIPPTGDVQSAMPTTFALFQNYPNPFNPLTVLRYSLPVNSYVTLKAYDVVGREIATLVNEQKQAGNYTVPFDASDIASGVYFYKLVSGSFIDVKRMLLIK